ncbi:MAG: tRNA (adenosine(37)-N6)-threonylcarbamoyltransferase complex dimerization subunit type 1 TsaB [Lachnospiraceae bacterium]|nr:tRNA (adenosine(37)-N6)-threonylcarbamoyltransferase complex dimerization subunit type 1 TsaB [Lachnospiraceae bacterium]
MKILALDSSGLTASIAVVDNDIMVAEYTINYKKTHSQTLLPMLERMAAEIELDLNTLDYIAVAAGPGSFTGLRIGSATAKGLGLALKKPLVHIPTVDALAYNFCGTDKMICPMMDARKSQVYTGIYQFQENHLHIIEPQCAVAVEELLAKLNGFLNEKKEVIFLGDGVSVYLDKIKQLCQLPYSLALAHMSRQRAGAVAMLAKEYIEMGRVETAAEHVPDYLRLSQAERERLAKGLSI